MCEEHEHKSSATAGLNLLRIYLKNAMYSAQNKLKIELNSIAGANGDTPETVEHLSRLRQVITCLLKELEDTSERNLVALCNRYVALDYDLEDTGRILKSSIDQLSRNNEDNTSRSFSKLHTQVLMSEVVRASQKYETMVTQEIYIKTDVVKHMRKLMKQLKSEINNHYDLDKSLRPLSPLQISKKMAKRSRVRELLHDILLVNNSDIQPIAHNYYILVND